MKTALRTGVVVQMRIDSTRLHQKALLPLGGTTLAGSVLRVLSKLGADEHILASDAEGALLLAAVAQDYGFDMFEGPKDDVLARYALAAKSFGLDIIVRATGDNPFVSIELARLAMDLSAKSGADYVGLVGMPTGMGVEVITVNALNKAHENAVDEYAREHVCPYIYNHPELFKIERPTCPPSHYLPQGRLTVDTESDYTRALNIVDALGAEPDESLLMNWLRTSLKDTP
jgi:spore coat polysaccharide biosynthesis protein SpsF